MQLDSADASPPLELGYASAHGQWLSQNKLSEYLSTGCVRVLGERAQQRDAAEER